MYKLRNILVERITDDVEYTKISNKLLKDNSISLQSKGLLVFLLTLNNKTNYSASVIADLLNSTTAVITKCLEELEIAQYLHEVEDNDGFHHLILQYT